MSAEQPPKTIVPFRQKEKMPLFDIPTLAGDIHDTSAEIMSQLLEAEAINKKGGLIEMVVKSEGGNPDEAMILVQDILRIRETYGVKVRAYIKGYADSSASFIVAMCDERIALGHTEFLLHEPRYDESEEEVWQPRNQTLQESRYENYETRRNLRREQKLLAKRVGKPLSEIIAKYKEDRPMTEVQAMEFGILDRAVIYER